MSLLSTLGVEDYGTPPVAEELPVSRPGLFAGDSLLYGITGDVPEPVDTDKGQPSTNTLPLSSSNASSPFNQVENKLPAERKEPQTVALDASLVRCLQYYLDIHEDEPKGTELLVTQLAVYTCWLCASSTTDDLSTDGEFQLAKWALDEGIALMNSEERIAKDLKPVIEKAGLRCLGERIGVFRDGDCLTPSKQYESEFLAALHLSQAIIILLSDASLNIMINHIQEDPGVYERFEPWTKEIPTEKKFNQVRDALSRLNRFQMTNLNPRHCFENVYPLLNVIKPIHLDESTRNIVLMGDKFKYPEHSLLREDLFHELVTHITTTGVAVISGMGGMGKSTIAKQFAKFMMGNVHINESTCPITKPQYEQVFWVTCATEAQALSDLEEIFNTDIGGDVLITTRLETLPAGQFTTKLIAADSYMKLQSWSTETTREYILRCCPGLDDAIRTDEERQAFDRLVRKVDGHKIVKRLIDLGLVRKLNTSSIFTHSLIQDEARVLAVKDGIQLQQLVGESILAVLGSDPYNSFQFEIGIHVHHFGVFHVGKESYGSKLEIAIDRASGLLYIYKGLFSQAETTLESCKEKTKEFYGTTDDPDYALILNKLGNVLNAQRRYEDAHAIYVEALQIYESSFGRKHESVATILRCMGMVANSVGNAVEGEVFLTESLEIFKEVYSTSHKEVAATLNNLGNSFTILKKYSKAIKCYEDSLKIKVNLYGTRVHSSVATNLHNMGKLAVLRGDTTSAKHYFKECCEIRTEIFRTTNHPEYAMVLEDIADIDMMEGRFQKAYLAYLQVYATYCTCFGEENSKTESVKIKKSNAESKLGGRFQCQMM
ncbi:hypothetical protein HDU79_000543 [Rhizoclosmatium sp. JEL0117]|nr:hypothetical protein HDU79_000543 [Rhizoclosmatium sp. JEL0117]